MKIKTKYDIGYQFYVPRVRAVREKDTISIVDNEGYSHEYYRDLDILTAYVRQKSVKKIEILVTADGTDTIYHCDNVGENSELYSRYHEDDMGIIDQDIAMAIAKKWRDEEQCEFFG